MVVFVAPPAVDSHRADLAHEHRTTPDAPPSPVRAAVALSRERSAHPSTSHPPPSDPFTNTWSGGLIGRAARTAVVAGTATAVVGGVQRHQQAKAEQAYQAQAYEQAEQAAAQQAVAPQPGAPAGGDDTIAELERLAQLKQQGLSDAEFAAESQNAWHLTGNPTPGRWGTIPSRWDTSCVVAIRSIFAPGRYSPADSELRGTMPKLRSPMPVCPSALIVPRSPL
jgi:hypothetical protein